MSYGGSNYIRKSNSKARGRMGLIGTTFTLMVGAFAGAYVEQNYEIPNIKEKLAELPVSKRLEELRLCEKFAEYRKLPEKLADFMPKKKGERAAGGEKTGVTVVEENAAVPPPEFRS